MKVFFLLVLIFVIVYGCSSENSVGQTAPNEVPDSMTQEPNTEETRSDSSNAPDNLVLPFNLNDLDISRKLISPFGLVRHSKDFGIGHGGIDIPLNVGDEIYAPAGGEIIENVPATDGRGGNNVRIKLREGLRDGEAWVFLFEHITLDDGLEKGSLVTKGQVIGQSAITQGANHMALEYLFNNLQYTKDHTCWVDSLSSEEKKKFEDVFNKLKTQQNFIGPWNDAHEDEYYSYRGALDSIKYPNGPQLCYPLGTDVRIVVE